jgi:Tol biopolymer transport system component
MLWPRRLRSRLLWRAAGCALLFATLVGCQILPGGGSVGKPAPNAQGRIVWPREGDLWILDLATRQSTRVTELPRGAQVFGASWSPDGQQIVYSQFWRRPGETSSGADLMVVNADGTDPRVLVDRGDPSTLLESPVWAASGNVYYTARRVEAGREMTSVVRQKDGGPPETLADDAFFGAPFPDESSIVYVRASRVGQGVWKRSLAANGRECSLLPDTVFQLVGQPRVSPDGSTIAVAASGDPVPGTGTCQSAPTSASTNLLQNPPPGALPLATLLGLAPSVASAHGLPWDIWWLNPDGSGLSRTVELQEDEPTVAWAPDGSAMAIFGVGALYLADASNGQVARLVDQGGYGGLDWTR